MSGFIWRCYRDQQALCLRIPLAIISLSPLHHHCQHTVICETLMLLTYHPPRLHDSLILQSAAASQLSGSMLPGWVLANFAFLTLFAIFKIGASHAVPLGCNL